MAPQLVENFPQEKGYLHTYCSVGIYILTLLLDGYKFNEHTWSSIHFSQQVSALWDTGSRQAAAAASLPWPEDTCRSDIPGVPCARNVSPSHGCYPVIPAQLHSFLPAPKPLTPVCFSLTLV